MGNILNYIMEGTEKLFSSFQKELRKSSLKVLRDAGHDELKELKRKNEELELSNISLEEEMRTLKASISFIQNLGCWQAPAPVRINLKAKGERMQLRSSDGIESPLLSQNDDDISRGILNQIGLTINEDKEYLDLISKRDRLISNQKKLESPDFSDFMLKNLFDENNNLLIDKKQKIE